MALFKSYAQSHSGKREAGLKRTTNRELFIAHRQWGCGRCKTSSSENTHYSALLLGAHDSSLCLTEIVNCIHDM